MKILPKLKTLLKKLLIAAYYIIKPFVRMKLVIAVLLLFLFVEHILIPIFYQMDFFAYANDQMEITDLGFERKTATIDTNIIIVNIGELSRGGIANLIGNINKYNPKVVGVDVFFGEKRNIKITKDTTLPLGDMTFFNKEQYEVKTEKIINDDSMKLKVTGPFESENLNKTLSMTKNLIMASNVVCNIRPEEFFYISDDFFIEGIPVYDTLLLPDTYLLLNSAFGHVNLNRNISDYIVRSFFPVMKEKEDDTTYKTYHFAIKVAEFFKPAKSKKFLSRKNIAENINFRKSDIWNNKIINHYDISSKKINPDILKDKIVLLGYIGKNEDYHDTPLGKMNGVLIHASIISSILTESYIDSLNSKLTPFQWEVIIFFYIYSLFLLFELIFQKKRHLYDLLSKGIAFFLSFIFFTGSIYLLSDYDVKFSSGNIIALTLLAPDFYEIYTNNISVWLKKLLNLFLPKSYRIN